MSSTFAPAQPESHQESQSFFPMQRELPLLAELKGSRFVDDAVVDTWQSYREAVVWCWANQWRYRGINDKGRQLIFANAAGIHPPHVSRSVKANSKAPMNLSPDALPQFEAFTGLRGVSQYLNKRAGISTVHSLEKVLQAALRAAA